MCLLKAEEFMLREPRASQLLMVTHSCNIAGQGRAPKEQQGDLEEGLPPKGAGDQDQVWGQGLVKDPFWDKKEVITILRGGRNRHLGSLGPQRSQGSGIQSHS